MSEPIIVDQKQFELPIEGWHNTELIEVIDLGIVNTSFGSRRKLRFRYQVEQKGTDGQPLTLIESFNASLGAKSNLYQRIKSLTGEPPRGDFNVSSLVGWKGAVEVEHNEGENGKTYANIRKIKRQAELKIPKKAGLTKVAEVSDDDVPF